MTKTSVTLQFHVKADILMVNYYQKLLFVLGILTFWFCRFSSLLHKWSCSQVQKYQPTTLKRLTLVCPYVLYAILPLWFFRCSEINFFLFIGNFMKFKKYDLKFFCAKRFILDIWKGSKHASVHLRVLYLTETSREIQKSTA